MDPLHLTEFASSRYFDKLRTLHEAPPSDNAEGSSSSALPAQNFGLPIRPRRGNIGDKEDDNIVQSGGNVPWDAQWGAKGKYQDLPLFSRRRRRPIRRKISLAFRSSTASAKTYKSSFAEEADSRLFCYLVALPKELQIQIIASLPLPTILSMRLVSRSFHELITLHEFTITAYHLKHSVPTYAIQLYPLLNRSNGNFHYLFGIWHRLHIARRLSILTIGGLRQAGRFWEIDDYNTRRKAVDTWYQFLTYPAELSEISKPSALAALGRKKSTTPTDSIKISKEKSADKCDWFCVDPGCIHQEAHQPPKRTLLKSSLSAGPPMKALPRDQLLLLLADLQPLQSIWVMTGEALILERNIVKHPSEIKRNTRVLLELIKESYTLTEWMPGLSQTSQIVRPAAEALEESEPLESKESENRRELLPSNASSSNNISLENLDGIQGASELHLLEDKSVEVPFGDWKSLRTLLPDFLRWDIEYSKYCWTFTPSDSIDPEKIPLTIAGAPVVIPVYQPYSLTALVAPPPDPHPWIIDPKLPLAIKTVQLIFNEFPEASGFYLLINGMLQLMVDDDFDHEWALSHRPASFGKLNVSFIHSSMNPTAGRLPGPSQTISTETRRTVSSFFGSGHAQRVSPLRPTVSIELDDFIETRAKGSKSKERHVGKMGVKTSHQGKVYLTISSHVITSSLFAKYNDALRRRLLGTLQEELSDGWVKDVEMFSHNVKIGEVVETFDPGASHYPQGFQHDVSLVELLDTVVTSGAKSPIPNLRWLSQEGWNNLRGGHSKLQILSSQDNQAKSIPSLCPSQIQIVGEGVFLNKKKLLALKGKGKPRQGFKSGGEEELNTWKSLIARSLLYRVSPDFGIPGGQSGLALWADGMREDGTAGLGVAGFQSFVQNSGHVQTYDIEGDALDSRLRKGLVAFYGAFQVPDLMRKEHIIL